MRKNVFGKQLKRDKNERTALFKGLLSALVLEESIKTTEAKAKAIHAEADKLVKKARKEQMLAKRLLSMHLIPEAMEKMITDVAPRFDGRKGGYTRIIKLGNRLKDNAAMVILEWVEKKEVVVAPKETKKEEKKEKVQEQGKENKQTQTRPVEVAREAIKPRQVAKKTRAPQKKGQGGK